MNMQYLSKCSSLLCVLTTILKCFLKPFKNVEFITCYLNVVFVMSGRSLPFLYLQIYCWYIYESFWLHFALCFAMFWIHRLLVLLCLLVFLIFQICQGFCHIILIYNNFNFLFLTIMPVIFFLIMWVRTLQQK